MFACFHLRYFVTSSYRFGADGGGGGHNNWAISLNHGKTRLGVQQSRHESLPSVFLFGTEAENIFDFDFHFTVLLVRCLEFLVYDNRSFFCCCCLNLHFLASRSAWPAPKLFVFSPLTICMLIQVELIVSGILANFLCSEMIFL